MDMISNWTREEYECDYSKVRSTQLKSIMSPQGPRAYYWQVIHHEPEPQPAKEDKQPKVDDLVLGTLFHEFVLEHQQNWFVCDERYGTKRWLDCIDENSGKWALKQPQSDMLLAMADGVRRNKRACELLDDNGFAEQTILWTHRATNIEAKTRLDLLGYDGTIVDLKTSRYSTRRDFDRQIIQLRYDFSAAFYAQAVQATPEYTEMRASFIHIVVSKSAPHYCYVWTLDDSYLRTGHHDVEEAFEKLATCLEQQRRCEDEALPVIDAWPDELEATQSDSYGAPDWFLSKRFNPDFY